MRTGPIDRNLTSLTNLVALLNRVLLEPGKFIEDKVFRAALESQGALAKYESVDNAITPSSLNTQKRLSASKFPEGYVALDRLRRTALERIESVVQHDSRVAKSKRTLSGLKDSVSELKTLLRITRQDCSHLSGAFVASLQEATNTIGETGDASLIAKWAKTRAELLARTTLSSRGLYPKRPEGDPNEPTD